MGAANMSWHFVFELYFSAFERGVVVDTRIKGIRKIPRPLKGSLLAVQLTWREWKEQGRTRLQSKVGAHHGTTTGKDRDLVLSALPSRTSFSK